MENALKIGFVLTCMAEFDAVLDVRDVREANIPDISNPEYADGMRDFLKTFGTVVDFKAVGNVSDAKSANTVWRNEEIDILVVHQFAFTLGETFAALVKGIDAPIIFWNTQIRRNMDEGTDFSTVMSNNSVSSIPHSANVLFQAGREDFWVITGEERDESASKKFREIMGAVSAKKCLRSSKIASIGYVYPGMNTLSVNEEKFGDVFGVEIDRINPTLVKTYFNNADEETVSCIREMIEESDAHLFNDTEIDAAARYYAAFSNLVSEKRISAMALLCGLLILDKDMGTAPCWALSKLAEKGIHTACECDVPSTAALIIAQAVAGNAHFTEFYMMDMDTETLLCCHCGYGNCKLANAKYPVKLTPQPCFPSDKGNGVALEFTVEEGIVTVFSITDSPLGYKIVAFLANSLDRKPYPVSCPQAFIQFKDCSLAEGVEKYCKAGGSHHMALCRGDITGELEILAQMLGVGYEKI